MYKTEDEIQAKLKKSDYLLKHYISSIERSSQRGTVLEDLANEHIYIP